MRKMAFLILIFLALHTFSYPICRTKKSKTHQHKKNLLKIQRKARKLSIIMGLKKLLEPDREKEMQIEFDAKSLIRSDLDIKIDNLNSTQRRSLNQLTFVLQGVDQSLQNYESKAEAGVGSLSASILNIAKIASSKFE